MPAMPYPVMKLMKDTAYQTPTNRSWKLWLDLADNENQKFRRESLSILTHIAEPPGEHPQGLELAAIRRVHALLGEQIVAMQSQ